MNVPWGNGRFERVLVYGLGVSGQGAARFLLSRGVAVVGVDRRPAAELGLGPLAAEPGLELVLGPEPAALPAGIDGVVLSPGVPPERPLLEDARRRGVPVIAEVELAFAFFDGPAVGITGSNGKSTTTALTGELLRAGGFAVEVCGNIGTSACDAIDGPPGRVFVLELSSFQLEAIDSFRPRAAALLNVSPDHLDRHGGLAAYADAKRRLFVRQEEGDVAVLNADDPEAARTTTRGRRRFFSRRAAVADGCYLAGTEVVEVEPGGAPRALFATADLSPSLAGLHNLENAMASALLVRALEVPVAAIRRGLAGFVGLPHRVEQVGTRRGVTWLDDSKGTNVAATAASLEGFADRSVHLILGGRNKGADLAYLRPLVEQKARRLYLIGESAGDFARALAGAAPLEEAGTLAEAVRRADAAAAPGEVVLLSPACASFDQFRDYRDRGETFKRLVRDLHG